MQSQAFPIFQGKPRDSTSFAFQMRRLAQPDILKDRVEAARRLAFLDTEQCSLYLYGNNPTS
jgi:hypothetical protein